MIWIFVKFKKLQLFNRINGKTLLTIKDYNEKLLKSVREISIHSQNIYRFLGAILDYISAHCSFSACQIYLCFLKKRLNLGDDNLANYKIVTDIIKI